MREEDLRRLRASTEKSGVSLKMEHPAVITKVQVLVQQVQALQSGAREEKSGAIKGTQAGRPPSNNGSD